MIFGSCRELMSFAKLFLRVKKALHMLYNVKSLYFELRTF